MLTTILILFNKTITLICKLLGKNGSVFPGSIVYPKDEHILEKIKYPKYVIGISGSSGKGSTTALVANILSTAGYSVCWNESGSNGIFAAITLILNNAKLNHHFKHDILLLELDERHIKLIFKKNILTHLLVTNITRDQPARNAHPDMIFNELFESIGDDTHLIINADDPIVSKIRLSHKGLISTFGISKTIDSYKKSELNSVDQAYCPKCHSKLKYTYYHYGHLGSYKCPRGDFGRDLIDYEAKDVNLSKKRFKIKKDTININKDILYEVYSTTAAFALCSEIGVSKEQILYALNEGDIHSKRGKVYSLNNRSVNILESKNENALSYYQSLKYITSRKGNKTVILGFDNVSRRYEYNDLSWLWDVEFELLEDPNIDKIICIGRFKYDIANRLVYAGIKEEKLILVDDINSLFDIAKEKSKGTIFTMVCFDMSAIIKNMLKEGESIHENS